MKNNFSVSIFWLSVFSILIIGYMIISVQSITRSSFTKSNGVIISAADSENIDPIEIDTVSQFDSEWEMKIMCDDIRMRMCDYGSQLCCTSAIFNHLGFDYDPDELYDMFLEKNLYSFDGSNIFYEAPYEYIFMQYSFAYAEPKVNTVTQFNSETIISLLNRDIPVMIRTTGLYVTRLWVVIVGVQDSNFIIMDPFTGEYGTLDTYNDRVFEVVYFTKK